MSIIQRYRDLNEEISKFFEDEEKNQRGNLF